MRKPSRLVSVVAMVAVMVLSWTPPAGAQRRQEMQLLSDAETEHIIRDMARPIFQAAGIDAAAVNIILVNDNTINAFVAGGQNIFLHTGLLLNVDDAGQLLGVIAHETGHIAGGHLVRGADAMENAFLSSLIGMGIGVLGGIAAKNAGAGAAGLMLGQHLAERNFLSFSRSQESSADQAGLSYLEQSGISARGMETFLEKLGVNEDPLLTSDPDAGYRRTHPLTRERLDSVERFVANSRYGNRPIPAAWNEQFRRIQAKLYAYLDPNGALRRYRADDPSFVARYGRAYAYFRRGEVKQALPLVDGLIAQEPKNPFMYEVKGDLMLQTGRAPDAVAPYRKAIELQPDANSIRVSLAHALLEQNDPRLADEALKNLQVAAKSQQGQSSFLWRLQAQAWSMKGNNGMVAYATAEEAFARGDKPMARAQAERAEKLLPAGSPGWLRAQDIRGQAGGK
ncbi:M48 family metalloprotease [Azospirillum rugosum]|uniref:Zn-dependent protease n=2 Tax=Azospirillum rugosum TaxID=416170 RepID=A0ABS4SQJ8_9PROT|nr:M48 family metalloprotease [Azospirillum rugosum]MBP2294831.1 putative Zn-dependent protease [Azospirillum rugosum]MDQ0528247.1 putative Zn-dependent protease [Azospirillum rugosum]